MENQLKRKYGLLMAMCMVVGTVIGSGIFFRNEEIITYVGGRMWIGVAAWALGGLITLAFAYVLATLATRHEKVGGLVDYSEAMLGKTYGYILGWFMATVFYPSMTGTLAWVSARFTVELFGWHTNHGVNQVLSGETWAIALFYLVMIYTINGLSPKLSEKFQVSGTFIKLVPLLIMGVVGTIVGLVNGVTLENFNFTPIADLVGTGIGGRQFVVGDGTAINAFFYAFVATAFAYLGWDCVINLNSEIRDSKKNLPRALVAGSIIIMLVYVLYFLGIFGSEQIAVTAVPGGTRDAFISLFSPVAGTVLVAFIVCSCLGTLNGLTVATQRSFYAISVRNTGPNPEVVKQVDSKTNVPNNSTLISMFLVAVWMLVIFANANGTIFSWFSLNVTNLVPIVFNALFFPLYIAVMIKQTDFGVFNRFIAPFLAAAGAAFFMFAVWFRERNSIFVFMIVSAVLSIIGLLFTYGKGKEPMKNVEYYIAGLCGIIAISAIVLFLV